MFPTRHTQTRHRKVDVDGVDDDTVHDVVEGQCPLVQDGVSYFGQTDVPIYPWYVIHIGWCR